MKRVQGVARPFVYAAVFTYAAVFLASAPSFAGTIIRVNGQSGNDANDGQAWTTTKKTVTAGLAAAASGDQVWVAAGTYVECVTLKDGVALYGGFAGNETELTQRDWTANQTILDGNQAGSVVTSPAGAAATTRIDGFTITNGTGTPVNNTYGGGGIYCNSSSPTISNNTITENVARSLEYVGGRGGGIGCFYSSATIVNNAITRNTARQGWQGYGSGGGIYCYYSSPTIGHNTIAQNTGGYGGGINLDGSSPLITNNTISKNTARSGGGIWGSSGTSTVGNNTIVGNTATEDGGGICSPGIMTISNNTIAANSASRGGGIWGSGNITNNTIVGNTASSGNGGGIHCSDSVIPRIVNTVVAFNSSGINCRAGRYVMTLTFNCVYGNAAYGYSGLVDPTGTNGNIAQDPRLAAWQSGNLHIQPGSPCIDAGNDSVVLADWLDLDGQPRIQGAHVDIGADESDGTEWPTAPYAIVRVSRNGNDANDGLTWASARQSVQAGLNAAQAGDEVWVAAGTYVECITLKDGVALYGGFAGSETELTQRDWRTNETILDANAAERVVTSPQGAMPATRIDGFTIRNGSTSEGAGIYCSASSPTIANNRIVANAGSSSGGGIYCSLSSPIITGNTIAGNYAYYAGGAIFCSSSSPTLTDNTITENTGGYSTNAVGGIACDSSSLIITHNTIASNTGGGISCSQSSLMIAYNIISGNTHNGGIACSASSGFIMNNTISGNSVSTAGVSFGGGISCRSCSPTIANNMIAGNSSFSGGGIYCNASSPMVTNNTMTGNNGTAVFCESSSSPVITNTIIAFNSAGVYASGSSPALRYNCVYENLAYNYSGLTDPTGTNGNIAADPRLASPQYGNCHTQPDSPCIDAGDNSVVLPGWRDMDDTPRIQHDIVDIGADEFFGATPWLAIRRVLVSPTGSDDNDGSTWFRAKRTVQAGIDAATDGYAGEVWVRTGTYLEQITLPPYAYVYGGFRGVETARNQRDCRANTTILDGQRAGTVVTAQTGYFVSTIDGFTIRNGLGKDGAAGGLYCNCSSPTIANNTITGNVGGGIVCMECSSPAIVNNAIVGNTGLSGGGISCSHSSPMIVNDTIVGNNGDAIYCGYSSFPTITNTIIAFNSAGVFASDSAPILRFNCVYANAASAYSGVTDPTGTDGNISADPKLAGWQYGKWHIQPDSPCMDAGDDSAVQPGWLDLDAQLRIQGPHVDIGADESDGTEPSASPNVIVRVSPGGNDANDGSSWTVTKRTVQAGIDAASAAGGEVWVKAGTYLERVELRPFSHVFGGFAGAEAMRDQREFRANRTVLDGQLGGSVVTVSSAGYGLNTIDGFTIRNGKAAPSGGGIYCSSSSPTIANNTITGIAGSGITCYSSSPTITNNTIAQNSGRDGGGISCAHSSFPRIVNNTIVGNSGGWGGGVYCDSSSPTIVNTIIAFNSSGIYVTNSGSIPTLRYNCVYANPASNYSGLTDPTGTNGSIAADPRLVDSQYGNLHVRPDSPCVNAGDDTVVQPGWFDMDNQSRIQGPHVDIGADESDGTEPSDIGPYVIVRVSPDSDDMNDGSTWAAAKRTVQAGIDAAAAAGGEVWVKAGTYPEQITLRTYAYVYGGFCGTEVMRDQRDFRANATILDAQEAGPVVTASAPAFALATIDGFTIRHGKPLSGNGIYCSYSSPTIANNTVTGNTSSYAGGIYCYASSSAIVNNTITGNTGGGVYCYASSSTIVDSQITGNSGPGIGCSTSSSTIRNNTITGNTASYGGGGIDCNRASPTIANNTIARNAGSGIYCVLSPATIVNNTITANTAPSGGGIYCFSSSPTIANTIVAFNSSGLYQDSYQPGTASLGSNCAYGNTAYNYSGLTDPTGTNGNLSADPLFVDRPGGDYHLKPVSPCVNAGDAAGDYAGQTDIDGDPRVAYGRVDIGADEFLYRGPLDFDLDNDVDLADFGFFKACFGGSNRPYPNVALCPQADVDADTDVDLLDFAAFRTCFNGPNQPPRCR